MLRSRGRCLARGQRNEREERDDTREERTEVHRWGWREFERAGPWQPGAYDPFGLLPTARQSLPAFYATASPRDRDLMDSLVMVHGALAIGLNLPRSLPAPVRTAVELQTNKSEESFIELRELVRTSPTFSVLSEADRRRVEVTVFEVCPPLDLRD